MTSLISKTVLVYDYGLFAELAVTLSKSFGRTIYCRGGQNGFPSSKDRIIGSGVKGVECVDEIWPYIDDVDLVVFPDCYESGLQEYLAKIGKRVWGSRNGAELELDRVKSKEISRRAGVDVGGYEVVTGIDDLREYLKTHDDQFVKVSGTRGDFETFRASNYEKIEPRLDELEHVLGPIKNVMEFIVEDEISPAVEAGYDGFTINGQFAKGALVGVEIKDEAYLGLATSYSKMPAGVRQVNYGLAPALKRYNYRGFLSTEVRCTPDGKGYLIDPTCRMPAPPGELYQTMVGNLAEIMWYGAEGILIEPEYVAKWGAEVLLISDWASDNWQQVSFPKSVRESVKLRKFCVIDGEYYVVPGMAEIGAVIGMGDTAQEAIEEAKRVADLVDGYSIKKPTEALDKALLELKAVLKNAKMEESASPARRKAEEMFRAGKISAKQLDKMVAAK